MLIYDFEHHLVLPDTKDSELPPELATSVSGGKSSVLGVMLELCRR